MIYYYIIVESTLPTESSIPGLIAEVVLNCNFSYKSLLPRSILKNKGDQVRLYVLDFGRIEYERIYLKR
jgi:hypothetical protein